MAEKLSYPRFVDSGGKGAIRLKDGWFIQPCAGIEGGGDVHDTFHVDESGNITKSHTTVQLRGGKRKPVGW